MPLKMKPIREDEGISFEEFDALIREKPPRTAEQPPLAFEQPPKDLEDQAGDPGKPRAPPPLTFASISPHFVS